MARKTASESILREKTVGRSKVNIKTDSRLKSMKSISIISVLLVIGICIVVNLILDMTLDKKLTYDTTSVKSKSISRFSESYLDSLDKKVEIIGLFDRNDTSLEWRDYFLPVMDDYEAKGNGMIDVKYIDPNIDPFILNELDPDNLQGYGYGMYVIRCGDRMIALYPLQCFSYEPNIYSYYGVYMPISNNIELNVTGSIAYVVSSRPRNAYVLTGHGDVSYFALQNIMKANGFATSELSLKSENAQIPDDCELLMILQPKSDLTITEKELIKTYLDNHGKVLIVNDFSDNANVDYTNLNEVTKKMGVIMENGKVHENSADALRSIDDPFHSIGFATDYCMENLSVSNTFDIENCRYMKVYKEKPENIEVAPIVVTSEEASVDFANTEIDSSVSSGTYPVVFVCSDTSETVDPPYMVVISTSAFTSDDYYTSLNNSNAVFVKSLLGDVFMTEFYIGDYMQIIPTKSVPTYILSQPLSSQSVTWWSICVMTIIPVGSLICGIYIYKKRRHL